MVMDFAIKTVRVNEHQLFNMSQFTDDLLKTDPEVKDAGVCKLLLADSSQGKGTSLSDLIAIGKSHELVNEVKKQYLFGFEHCPNVYGHRTFHCKVGDETVTDAVENQTDENQTDDKDLTSFITDISNEKSYKLSSCCSSLLEEGHGESVVSHFFTEVIPSITTTKKSFSKSLTLEKLKSRGMRDAKNLSTFMSGMLTLPLAEREALIAKCLLNDKRQEIDTCQCHSCVADEGINLKDGKGVIYGSGVGVTVKDRIKVSSHFGLYALASTSLLRLLEHHYPGTTTSFLYYGTNHSFFPAHIKDASLFSLNYLHYGQPKIWIVVPPKAVQKVHECLAQTSASLLHCSCHNLLGHKFFLMTPKWLEDNDIPFKVVIQKAGEFVLVCPNAVHLGFNSGYNIAEASNFATPSWIPFGMVAPKCACIGGEAHLNLERIIAACRPDLLPAYMRNYLPEGEDSHFYESILIRKPTDVSPERLKMDTSRDKAVSGSKSPEQISDNEDSPFPELPTKPKGRKVVACPKITCDVTFNYRKKDRVERHVAKHHKNDPNYAQLQAAVKELFPDRNKCEKKECSKCGKLIAGRGAQMRMHQASSACIRK